MHQGVLWTVNRPVPVRLVSASSEGASWLFLQDPRSWSFFEFHLSASQDVFPINKALRVHLILHSFDLQKFKKRVDLNHVSEQIFVFVTYLQYLFGDRVFLQTGNHFHNHHHVAYLLTRLKVYM